MKLKTIAFVFAMLGVSFGYANDVYVEQVGDASTITINQEGTGNRVGTALDSVYIGSGSNEVAIDQIGSGNELDMVVNGSATNVTVNTVGSGNKQIINCGTTSSAGCSGSTITQTVTGDDNIITQNLGSGANHTSNITVTGDTNIITNTSTNTATTVNNITVAGDQNNVSLTQSGMLPKNVTVNSTGSLNTISITQSD
jgi:hypothetical protein